MVFPVVSNERSTTPLALCQYKSFLEMCEDVTRKSNFQESIEDFNVVIREAGIEPFLKIHLLDHVAEFFRITDEICPASHPGLSWTSEQAIESSHHHFAETWRRYKRTPGNKKKALVGALIDFNYTRFLTSFSE